MASPGFQFSPRPPKNPLQKSDGSFERFEENAAGDMLKKYRSAEGEALFSSVQYADMRRSQYLESLSDDSFGGFRATFGASQSAGGFGPQISSTGTGGFPPQISGPY